MALLTWRGRTSELAANKFHTRPHGCHGHRMLLLLLLLLPLLLLLLLHFSVSVSSSVRCGIICKMSLLVWILRSSKPRRSNWRSSGKAWLGWGWVEVIHRRPKHVSLSLSISFWLGIKVKHTVKGRPDATTLATKWYGAIYSYWSCAPPPDSYIIIKAEAELTRYRHISVCGIVVFIVYL